MSVQQHRIFVSHSHLDNDFGTRLAQDLQRALGNESAIWYDVLGGLHGGESWWEKIVEELTARDVFILVLSPDAMNSPWVRREINMALVENKFILPVLYRACTIRTDLKTIQMVSFLSPKTYEAAFKEVLMALGLPTETIVKPKPEKVSSSPEEPGTVLLRQIEKAFAEQDWPDVIRKVNYLLKRMPDAASSGVYRMQGLALLEEGQIQQAQEALESALALVEDRQQRLTVLSDYTGLLARQEQWDEVVQRAKEALRLVPNDPGWVATREQAERKMWGEGFVTQKSEGQGQSGKQEISSIPQKTKKEWVEEGVTLFDAKRYEEAIVAFDKAIELDPNDTFAYSRKGAALAWLGRYQEALVPLDEALHLDPKNTYVLDCKGNALVNLGRSQEALNALDEALRLDPNHAYTYRNKGFLLIKLGRYQESLVASSEALRLDPNDAYAHRNKGEALERLGRLKEAQQAYEKASELGYKG